MNSANQRASAVNPMCPWRGQLPFPDGSVDRIDRLHLLLLFAEFIVNITSTQKLNLPVDYALAGEQDGSGATRRGKFSGRGLRHIYRE